LISVGEVKERRKRAAERFKVEFAVLKKLGELADNKGGRDARKTKGATAEFTGAERAWLEEAMKCLIRRAAQIAYDPTAALPQITMKDDLPPL
jgi:hypothetical protein